jgi:hypothetical protein
MVTLEQIIYIVPILALTASILYYALVLRNSNKARQAQIYVQMYDKFSSPEFMENYFIAMAREWEDYDDYTEKYASQRYTNPKEYSRSVSVGIYFEVVGVLLKHGFINVQMVVDLLGTTVLTWWDKICPYMMEYRVRLNNPRAYMYAEYLYDQVKQVVQREHPEFDTSKIKLPPKTNR